MLTLKICNSWKPNPLAFANMSIRYEIKRGKYISITHTHHFVYKLHCLQMFVENIRYFGYGKLVCAQTKSFMNIFIFALEDACNYITNIIHAHPVQRASTYRNFCQKNGHISNLFFKPLFIFILFTTISR